MTHRIIPRAEWGAIHSNGAGPAPVPADEVWLHHSVTIAPDLVPPFSDDYAAVRTLERIGEDRFGAGISYTFPITPVGLIFEGHGIDRRGAHTYGHNTHGRAICFVGNYEADHPTDAMIDAAAWLLAHGFLSGWWDAAELQGGHRDVRQTSCPGRHAYAAMRHIDDTAARYVNALFTHTEKDAMTPDQEKKIHARIDGLVRHIDDVTELARYCVWQLEGDDVSATSAGRRPSMRTLMKRLAENPDSSDPQSVDTQTILDAINELPDDVLAALREQFAK